MFLNQLTEERKSRQDIFMQILIIISYQKKFTRTDISLFKPLKRLFMLIILDFYTA